MAFRLTKDVLAIILASVFLMWVVASAFAPIVLHVQVYNDKGQTLVILDVFAAALCFIGYMLIGGRLSERIAPEPR